MTAHKRDKASRGLPSSIDLLPEDIRLALAQALRERRLTQKEIVAHINALLKERGGPALSYSAVNRYSQQIEAQRQQLREAQEAANAIVGGLSESKEGDIGRALTEVVKSLTFDFALRQKKALQEDGPPVDPELLSDMALTVQRLERAAAVGQARALKLRAVFARECSEKLSAAVQKGQIQAKAAEEARRIMGFG